MVTNEKNEKGKNIKTDLSNKSDMDINEMINVLEKAKELLDKNFLVQELPEHYIFYSRKF